MNIEIWKTWALMFSLICAWINGWVNNREAGDLRRHCAHHYNEYIEASLSHTRGSHMVRHSARVDDALLSGCCYCSPRNCTKSEVNAQLRPGSDYFWPNKPSLLKILAWMPHVYWINVIVLWIINTMGCGIAYIRQWTGAGNGLSLFGTKPLPRPMIIQR